MTDTVPSSGLSAARVEEIEATFEKVPMTPEQKLAEAVASVQGEIEKIEEELREGEDSDNDEEIHHLAGQSIWADHLRTVLSALASAREETAQAVRAERELLALREAVKGCGSYLSHATECGDVSEDGLIVLCRDCSHARDRSIAALTRGE